MATEAKGWLASRFARLSTGLKMALIFSAALFPLGLVAILVSIQSAEQKKADRHEETLARLELKAQRLNSAFSRSVLTINTASVAISLTPEGSRVCETTLRQLEQGPVPVRYALYAGGGSLRCASAGFVPVASPVRATRSGTIARIARRRLGAQPVRVRRGRSARRSRRIWPRRPERPDLHSGHPPRFQPRPQRRRAADGASLRLQGRSVAADGAGHRTGRRRPAPAAASCSPRCRSPWRTCCSSCFRC